MDKPKSTPQQRNALLARRRDAIISSIYELFLSSDDPAQVSVFDIFNRVMLMLQSACMFVLVHVDQDTKDVPRMNRQYRSFNPHPGHQEIIKKAVDKSKRKDFISILGSEKYRLLVLEANQSNVPSSSKEYEFNPIDVKPRKEVEEILKAETYEERFGKEFLSYLTQIIDECKEFDITDNREKKSNSDPKFDYEKFGLGSYDKDYKYWYKEFIIGLESKKHGFNLAHDGVVDKAYKKSSMSLSYLPGSNKKAPLANFLFFLRDYSKNDYKRRDNYNYGLRILLCSDQEEQVKKFLLNLKGKEELEDWYSELIKPDNIYYEIGKKANAHFWRILQSINEDITQGNRELNKLIEIIKKPFKSGSYSMADPTFLSGIIHFRDPSVNAGLHRCVSEDQLKRGYDDLDEKKEQYELLRVVIVHYLLLGMAYPFDEIENRKENFSVMLAPISIGGRVLGVLGYVTKKERNQEDEMRSIADLSIPWRNNFHTYTSIHKRIKRQLRTYFWQFYVRMVFKMYCNTLVDLKGKNNAGYEDLELLINTRLSHLDRFFSYNAISCEIYYKENNTTFLHYPNKDNPYLAKISQDHVIEFNTLDRSMFSFYNGIEENNLGRFVDPSEIAVRISEAYRGILIK